MHHVQVSAHSSRCGSIVTEERSLILDVTPGDGRFDARFLESAGHPVLMCHGPDHGTLCPILKDGCSKVEEAHGVVFQLDLDRPQHRAILRRYKEVLSDDVPLWVSVHAGQDAEYAELLTDVHVVVGEPGVVDLDAFASLVEAADELR
jgi:hypothetical protein